MRASALIRILSLSVIAACLAGLSGCEKPRPRVARPNTSVTSTRLPTARIVDDSTLFKPQPIGAPIGRPPWIAHVVAADLDQDGKMDLLACEAQDNTVVWLRQTAPGVFEEKTVGTDLRAPVHVEAADMDGDGDLDLIVSSMGYVFPNNDKIGVVYILENDGHQNFKKHAVLENTSRVTDARAGDFNRDGKMDLALGQFGYDQGEIAWLERTGPWEFKYHVLLALSGAINVCVADFDGDRTPDIAALISQQWEEVYVFQNDGNGNFSTKRIWGSTNEDYGSSGMSLCDLNRDGRPDLLYSNGDGFGPAATPGPRPWHGVQWFENVGNGLFRYHRIGDLAGAYSPMAVDVDGDGATDVVAVAAYADWNNSKRNVISLMWFKNDGRQNFQPHLLSYGPKDQLTLAVGDFDGSGRASLVTGGFYIYPPYDAMGRLTLWRR
ncbi:VCBS repeat-containing protein [Opitutaceae bacterium EW11]|nr:VCBS repeat-containing protein [Opitutaceae bacterium EW11]